MKLNEILNSKADIEVYVNQAAMFVTKAAIGKRTIEFHAYKFKEVWSIEFNENGHTFDLTKSGNEFEVFAMIKKSMEMLIQEHDPKEMKFSANKKDKSRASAYEKLLKRFIPKGYSFTTGEQAGDSWQAEDAVEFRIKKDEK